VIVFAVLFLAYFDILRLFLEVDPDGSVRWVFSINRTEPSSLSDASIGTYSG
jgi:hypothetical protein